MAARPSKSKKGSDANYKSELPPETVFTFFLDKCLGRHDVRTALEKVGVKVEIHIDHFAEDAEDAEWLPIVGKKGWIVLTKDRHLLSNQLEVIALLRSGAPAFVLKAADMTGDEMAQAFVIAHKDMIRLVKKKPAPFIASVSRTGTVSYVEGYDGLVKRLKSDSA